MEGCYTTEGGVQSCLRDTTLFGEGDNTNAREMVQLVNRGEISLWGGK